MTTLPGARSRRFPSLISAFALALLFTVLCASGALALTGKDVPAGVWDWFRDYDITDTETVWKRLTEDIVVLDVGEKEKVWPLVSPGGKKVFSDKFGGFIVGETAAVRVLQHEGDGWSLIEGYDMHDRLVRGYVKTSLLKTRTPNQEMGLVVDKLTQRLYVFLDGELVTELMISTGLINSKQPYNETAQGDYLTASRVGGFWSDNLYCDLAIRFNGGDLLHEVPCLISDDGTKWYGSFIPKLGSKASHGCVRVQKEANADGYNMRWLWDNYKKGAKVMVWDEGLRALSYPADELPIYYNPNGGKFYHADANCSSIKKRYLPLTGFTYAEMDDGAYAKLKLCTHCRPPLRREEIDAQNEALVDSYRAELAENEEKLIPSPLYAHDMALLAEQAARYRRQMGYMDADDRADADAFPGADGDGFYPDASPDDAFDGGFDIVGSDDDGAETYSGIVADDGADGEGWDAPDADLDAPPDDAPIVTPLPREFIDEATGESYLFLTPTQTPVSTPDADG